MMLRYNAAARCSREASGAHAYKITNQHRLRAGKEIQVLNMKSFSQIKYFLRAAVNKSHLRKEIFFFKIIEIIWKM